MASDRAPGMPLRYEDWRLRRGDQQMSAADAPVKVCSTGHTGITVSDLDCSIRFYRDLLGCEVSRPVRIAGPIFEAITGVSGCQIDVAFARMPGHVIELLCYRNPPGSASTLRACDPGFMHLCIKVADLERVVTLVRSAGFQALGAVQRVYGGPVDGLKVVYVRDPDGVVLELIEEPSGVVLEEVYFR
jgi:catechol 2,3-dioxygenase-like lactoylglutathione lyase family enzyme